MKVALAFSGGLDTCWCIPVLREMGHEVVTVAVDVGGFSETERAEIAERSAQLGASSHHLVDAVSIYFNEIVRYLIAGNVMRGGIYPLCVGSERALQAREAATVAKQVGATAIAHGCTAAGNDQVRFEVAIRTIAPHLDLIAPVRELCPSRPEQLALLASAGLEFPSQKALYSTNSGLWGVTIGGAETTGTSQSIPEDAWQRTRGAFDIPLEERRLTLSFERGVPSGINGVKADPVDVIREVESIAAGYGIGRGIHLGETILGIKGRVAFEAPAATVIITAHRELEKLTLTKREQNVKDLVAAQYGEWVHEGLFTDPAARHVEALLESTQGRVTGEAHLLLRPGSVSVEGVESPHSLHAASRAIYGEAIGEWTATDANGFCKLYGLAGILHARAGSQA